MCFGGGGSKSDRGPAPGATGPKTANDGTTPSSTPIGSGMGSSVSPGGSLLSSDTMGKKTSILGA
jgi:hypothetical protein